VCPGCEAKRCAEPSQSRAARAQRCGTRIADAPPRLTKPLRALGPPARCRGAPNRCVRRGAPPGDGCGLQAGRPAAAAGARPRERRLAEPAPGRRRGAAPRQVWLPLEPAHPGHRRGGARAGWCPSWICVRAGCGRYEDRSDYIAEGVHTQFHFRSQNARNMHRRPGWRWRASAAGTLARPTSSSRGRAAPRWRCRAERVASRAATRQREPRCSGSGCAAGHAGALHAGASSPPWGPVVTCHGAC